MLSRKVVSSAFTYLVHFRLIYYQHNNVTKTKHQFTSILCSNFNCIYNFSLSYWQMTFSKLIHLLLLLNDILVSRDSSQNKLFAYSSFQQCGTEFFLRVIIRHWILVYIKVVLIKILKYVAKKKYERWSYPNCDKWCINWRSEWSSVWCWHRNI